ncbi:DUF2796 domain-containing protein [Microbulbifer thermotolerans]|uniref:ZrgA family zinc uptake protein n=1 Tax=Microbulbifer thermotolerans TaxID=252514 RepID=UPI0022493F3D|nr:DUF2796 domain-containing protein [Microbulbifer thermotolerans]MCX2794395.1 DUF2796 domain-containing protein [Microbulbifer thermotolerans]
MTVKRPLFFILLLFFSVEVRAHQMAHVHGRAHMSIAVIDNVLEVEFASPAENLVGFEHTPHTAKEKQALEATKHQLASGENLIRFNGANCRLEDARITVPQSEGDHAGLYASYRFHCDNLASIKSISVPLFASFSGIEVIEVQWLTSSAQGAETLTPKSNELQLQ